MSNWIILGHDPIYPYLQGNQPFIMRSDILTSISSRQRSAISGSHCPNEHTHIHTLVLQCSVYDKNQTNGEFQCQYRFKTLRSRTDFRPTVCSQSDPSIPSQSHYGLHPAMFSSNNSLSCRHIGWQYFQIKSTKNYHSIFIVLFPNFRDFLSKIPEFRNLRNSGIPGNQEFRNCNHYLHL